MSISVLFLTLLALMAVAHYVGIKRAVSVAGGHAGIKHLHSLPGYYGFYAALWAGLPALLLLALWAGLQENIVTSLVMAQLPPELASGLSDGELSLLVNDIQNLARGSIVAGEITPAIQSAAAAYGRLQHLATLTLWLLALAIGLGGLSLAWRRITPTLRARNRVEGVVRVILVVFSSIAILTTLGILLSVVFESLLFFQKVSVVEFFFGTEWSPQIALRQDQVGASGAFGAVPLFAGTLMVTVIAMSIAVPIGLMAAIYLSEYASAQVRSWAKPILEVLANP